MASSNPPQTPQTAPIQSIPERTTTNDSISSVGLTSPIERARTTPEKPSFLSSGMPKTPERVVVRVQNRDSVDNEYDTDNEIGPFYDQVIDEGELVPFENELSDMAPPIAETTGMPAPSPTDVPNPDLPITTTVDGDITTPIINDVSEAPAQPALSEEDVDKMKNTELKEELIKRGLARGGNKPVLIERLKEAIRMNVPLVGNMTAEVRNNLAGDAFNGGAHWAMLEQDGDIIVEETETEGERFRNPTVPRNQDWDYNTGDAPVKRDYATIADRGVFVNTVKKPVFNTNGTVRKRREKIVWKECNSEQTLPNVDFLEKNGIDHNSHPAEWVNLFIPWIKDRNNDAMMDLVTIANRTNMRIMASTS